MLHTVYFGNKPVYICNELSPEVEEVRHHPDAVFLDEYKPAALHALMHEIRKPEFHAGILFHPEGEKAWKAFRKQFHLVEAAGGVVFNEAGQILFIHRRGLWDLPKGKLDEGESLEECALREVQEETGLSELRLETKITVTHHCYDEFGRHILKDSHWYRMQGTIRDALIPQVSEDILDIQWVGKEALDEIWHHTYPSIRTVLACLPEWSDVIPPA